MILRKKTTFTDHALLRVSERLIESREELASILDNDLAVIIGVEPYSNRLSRLFLSLADHEYYVALQDFSTGSVVTVLPIEYYANLRGEVPEKLLRKAARKRGIEATAPELVAGTRSEEATQTEPPTVVRITAVNYHSRPPLKSLGSWPLNAAPSELSELAEDPEFIQEILSRLAAKGVACTRDLKIRLAHKKIESPIDIELGNLLAFPHRWLEPDTEKRDAVATAEPREIQN